VNNVWVVKLFGLGLGLMPLNLFSSAEASSITVSEQAVQPVANPIVTGAQTQIAQAMVRITGVKIESGASGLEIILETESGERIQPVTQIQGNTLSAEIPNAVLALSNGSSFTAENPAAGVVKVTVMQGKGQTVQVSVIGETAAPKAIVAVRPKAPETAQQPPEEELGEEEELVVTGQQEGGYAAPNSSIGTRTDTPIKDVPQSIQVVPKQVLEDQNVNDLDEALRNVSGVAEINGRPQIRGFDSTDSVLSDGVSRDSALRIFDLDTSNVEQIEVLKGPASVLYGSGTPGGTINITTEKPLKDPRYELGVTIGNFDFYRPSIDLTGPLNPERTILYRLNAAYENSGSFVDFINKEQWAIFPTLSFELSKNTKLTLEGGYQTESGNTLNEGLPIFGTILPNPLGQIPQSRNLADPRNRLEFTNSYVGYLFEHKFSENWSLKNRFRAAFSDYDAFEVYPIGLEDDNQTVLREAQSFKIKNQNYTLQTDILGKIETGIVKQDLLFGFELQRNTSKSRQARGEASPINLFNPDYGEDFPVRRDLEVAFSDSFQTDRIGIYAQDLISIGKQVKILVGGRYDWVFEQFEDRLTGDSSSDSASAFAPRIGIVYQPIQPVSLYASWSRSFEPQFGLDREGNPFVPITGEQFEAGLKVEFLKGKLTSTLSAYQITRQNDFVPDPIDPNNFQIQIGEQRSRGFEFDLTGEPLPGLRLIATYAYTDAKITEDAGGGNEGNRSWGVPRHSGSLWAVYEIQKGSLKGFGFGAGVFVVGDRPGDIENSFVLPAYARTDALLYYRRDNWRVQLNFQNLLNTDYFESSASRNNIFYGAPFTVKGQISVTF
jgi:iron complex outermembrane recepter protein